MGHVLILHTTDWAPSLVSHMFPPSLPRVIPSVEPELTPKHHQVWPTKTHLPQKQTLNPSIKLQISFFSVVHIIAKLKNYALNCKMHIYI